METKVQRKRNPKKSRRGASKPVEKEKNNWQFWKLLALGCVPVCLIVLLLNLNLLTQKPSEVAVEKVTIRGELRYVDREVVIERISGQLEGGFFTVDLRGIQKSLEKEPWIHSVAIKRIWPSTLEVTVKEQEALAYWGDNAYLNAKAEVFVPDSMVTIEGLPRLYGQERNLEAVWQQYQVFKAELAPNDLHITHLRQEEDGAWRLTTDKGFEIVFGAEKLDEKLERFQLVYERSLKHRVLEIGKVDLRYSNGLAVEWQQPAEQVVHSIR